MRFIEKIINVLARPTYFFEQIKSEEGIAEPLKYNLILSLIPVIIGAIVYFIFSFGLGSSILGGLGIMMYVAYFVFYVVFTLIYAIILHVFVIIFGGKNGFIATYKALVYSLTPTLLFGWLISLGSLLSAFILGFFGIFIIYGIQGIFGLYTWYLEVKGLSKLQDMTMARAFITTLIPGIIIVGVIIGFYIFGILFFFSGIYT